MIRLAPRPWDESYRRQGRLWRGIRLDPLTRQVLDERPELREARWFDAGCGDGKGLVALAREVQRVVGADASIWGLRLAATALQEGDHPANLLHADARSWPFADGAFEAVRSFHLLGHLGAAERPHAAAELVRVTRPGGTIVVVDFGSGDFRATTGIEVEPGTRRRGAGIWTHYFSAEVLESLFPAGAVRVVRQYRETFTVTYDGIERPRERLGLVLVRQDGAGV